MWRCKSICKQHSPGIGFGSSSGILHTNGKTFTFLMLSPGMVSPERFPEGYSISVSLTVNHIISILLACFIAHGVFTKNIMMSK